MEEIQQFNLSKSFCGTALDGHPLISAIFSKWQQDGFAVVFMELLKVRGNVKSIAPGITSNGLQSPTAAIFVQSPNSCMLFWITASAESTALGKYSGFV